MEDTFREGEEKEEQQDKEKIKEEDNGIEMSEDFDGQMHDGDEREEGRSDRLTAPLCQFHSGLGLPADRLIAPLSGQDDDDSSKEDEEEDELDKKMGDLGDGQTDTLDERMWGDEEDEEDEEASEKEEESGEGMDQVEEHGLQDELLQNSRWLVVVLYTSEHVSVCVSHGLRASRSWWPKTTTWTPPTPTRTRRRRTKTSRWTRRRRRRSTSRETR